MRCVYILLILVFIGLKSSAQYNLDYTINLKIVGDKYAIKNPEKVDGVIIYKQEYKFDTTDLNKQKVDTMSLSYSKHYSDFRLESMRVLDSLVSFQIKMLEKKNPRDKANFNYPTGTNKNFSKERFLCDGNAIYEHQDLYGVQYLLVYGKEKPKWNIEDSTKQICGFICQKAKCSAFGRNYTAWFTTDLPNSFGPRTLFGLPGVILEAYDSTHQINYAAIDIFTNTDPENVIGLPDKEVLCTKKEYDAMMETVDRDPGSFLNGQKGIAVGRTNVANGSFKYKKNKDSPKNAIELNLQ